MTEQLYIHYVPANGNSSIITVQCSEPFAVCSAVANDDGRLILPRPNSQNEVPYILPGIESLPYAPGLAPATSSRLYMSFPTTISGVVFVTYSRLAPDIKLGELA